jgi:hypothetical protein
METNDRFSYDKEDLRTEYSLIVGYHNSLVNSRFTIAGLYVAGIGVLAGVILGKDVLWSYRMIASGLACWLTLCLWILELRSRCLYTNLAKRGIDIEHNYWQLKGDNWYNGFFSRQYKIPPLDHEKTKEIPHKPGPDRPKLLWFKKTLPIWLSEKISHSFGFDLLYAGCGTFWIVVFVISFLKVLNIF